MEGKLLTSCVLEMTDGIILSVIGILFLATFVRASLGFGEALISVPLLALIMPIQQAAPIAVLASITVALIILAKDWRKVHFRSAGRLTVFTLFGIPAGLLLLKAAPEAGVRALLGVVIIAFSLYAFRSGSGYELKNDRLAWLFGFQAGVLGGAYGMNGPPLAVYGALRRWQPDDFRATLQAYFLPASVAGMSGYWLTGLWTPAVSQFYVASLPAVVIATLLGGAVNRRVDPRRFRAYVYGGLLVTGAVLLSQALIGR